MGLWDSYLRWRHSKGYGVHSPYAFKFITDVVNPGQYGYYSLHTVEDLCRGNKENRTSFINRAKFLLRVVKFLNSKRILTYREKYPEAQIVARALKIVYFKFESPDSVKFRQNDLLVVDQSNNKEKLVDSAISAQIPILAVKPNPGLRRELTKTLSNGVLFDWKDKILLIPRQQMHYVAYKL